MARRVKHEEHENLERWLVSYADFVTLLFAFFVVMYAISSVNEGKYRILADSLNAVFEQNTRSNKPIQIGEIARSPKVLKPDPLDAPPEPHLPKPKRPQTSKNGLDDLEKRLSVTLKDSINLDMVEVVNHGTHLEVRMKTKMLFGIGEATLSKAALLTLRDMAKVLIDQGHRIQVEGHTDNVPIRTHQFPSNWELSASRAASVVHYLVGQGLKPSRLAAVGYGEYRPVSDNESARGRAQNRRVSMMILAPGARSDLDETKNDADAQKTNPYALPQKPWAESPGGQ